MMVNKGLNGKNITSERNVYFGEGEREVNACFPIDRQLETGSGVR